jgi:LPS sulfotransferase NodH
VGKSRADAVLAPRRQSRTGRRAAALRSRPDRRAGGHTITAHEAAWRSWFTDWGLVPHEVAYEDLDADPTGVTLSVLEFLGLDPADGATITVRDRRQADGLNADWISRFHA